MSKRKKTRSGDHGVGPEVAEEIVRYLVKVEIRDGENFPSESQLSNGTGYCRSHVREGLAFLDGAGFVSKETPRRKLRIDPSHSALWRNLDDSVGHQLLIKIAIETMHDLQHSKIRSTSTQEGSKGEYADTEIVIARSAIEGAVAYQAAKNRKDIDVVEIQRTITDQDDFIARASQPLSEGDFIDWIALDAQFHEKVWIASKNRFLFMLRGLLQKCFHLKSKSVIPLNGSDLRRITEDHRGILAEIARPKGEGAEHAQKQMYEHIVNAKEAMHYII